MFSARHMATCVRLVATCVHCASLVWNLKPFWLGHFPLHRVHTGYLGTYITAHPFICHKIILIYFINRIRNAWAVGGNLCRHIWCMCISSCIQDAITITVPCSPYHLTRPCITFVRCDRPRPPRAESATLCVDDVWNTRLQPDSTGFGPLPTFQIT